MYVFNFVIFFLSLFSFSFSFLYFLFFSFLFLLYTKESHNFQLSPTFFDTSVSQTSVPIKQSSTDLKNLTSVCIIVYVQSICMHIIWHMRYLYRKTGEGVAEGGGG